MAWLGGGASGGAPMTAQQQQMQAQQINDLARQLVIKQGVDQWLQVYTQTFTTGANTIIQIPLRNVGLVKRLLVRVTATLTNPSGPTQTLTALGGSNFFSNVTLTDLSNQLRINTAGWHLATLQTVKRRRVYGCPVTLGSSPYGWGNNFPKVHTLPASIASGVTGTAYLNLEIPVSYTDHDLRGAIYANVVNATFNLTLTVNPNMFLGSAATDTTLGVYQSSSGTLLTMPSFQVQVYQNFLDQLPVGKQGVVLPQMDLSCAYDIKSTAIGGLTANQDNPIQYANYRDFYSTTVIFDNAGVLGTGDDLNYWALQSANYSNIFKIDPYTAALMTRLAVADDPPPGMYYFSHRDKPIATSQYGNMQLIANPLSLGGSSAALLTGFEAIAYINLITQAGSLYSGG